MGKIQIFGRSGDIQRFDEGLRNAKHGLMEVCEIWENMKNDFNDSGSSYSERYMPSRGGMDYRGDNYPVMSERDWHELQERRSRDRMGRYQ